MLKFLKQSHIILNILEPSIVTTEEEMLLGDCAAEFSWSVRDGEEVSEECAG
jgi:hypothetical protein